MSFIVFSALAASHFPTPYSPIHENTLSQLGNGKLNPHGAIFYLIGCAVTGLLAIAFFVSLFPWRDTGTSRQNRLLVIVQIVGVGAGLALIMNAVYPETSYRAHHFWAGVVFNGVGLVMLLAPFALWRPGRPNLSLAVIPSLGAVAVILMFIFAGVHWVEWIPVSLFLLCPSLFGLHAREVYATRGRDPALAMSRQ